MTGKRVLLIGVDPTLVNFRPSSTRTVETIRAAGTDANERLAALGYEVHTCIVDLGKTAEAVVLQTVSQNQFDCIMIGAGVRAMIEHTLLFEKIINILQEHAPTAKLCFNTNPSDTVEAVLRWV